jgi:hypothetical protein
MDLYRRSVMTWIYNESIFEPDDCLKDYIGFVYLITEKDTGMKYIGKKLFWRSKILPITKTRKKRKKTLVESDWRKYHGSSKNLLERIEQRPEAEYTREILHLCKTKGECSYWESKLQFEYDVLLRDDFYNEMIMCRINSSHLLKMERKT